MIETVSIADFPEIDQANSNDMIPVNRNGKDKRISYSKFSSGIGTQEIIEAVNDVKQWTSQEIREVINAADTAPISYSTNLITSGAVFAAGTLLEPIVIDTNIEDLQATLDSLPRHLQRNTSIRVKPGEFNGIINISNFFGQGWLAISCVDNNNVTIADMNVQTHKVGQLYINNNSCFRINLRGFTLVEEDSSSSTLNDLIRVNYCSSTVTLTYCNLTKPNERLKGIYSTRNLLTIIEYCTISNKAVAIRADEGTTVVYNTTGENNDYIMSGSGGILAINTTNTIEYSITNVLCGLILKNGMVI